VVKISQRLTVFVVLLCVIVLALPSHVFCQAEGGSKEGTAGAAQPTAGGTVTGAGTAGGTAGTATAGGVSTGTIAAGAGIIAAAVIIGIAAGGGGGGGGTTTSHH
jgi:hypothetical protein